MFHGEFDEFHGDWSLLKSVCIWMSLKKVKDSCHKWNHFTGRITPFPFSARVLFSPPGTKCAWPHNIHRFGCVNKRHRLSNTKKQASRASYQSDSNQHRRPNSWDEIAIFNFRVARTSNHQFVSIVQLVAIESSRIFLHQLASECDHTLHPESRRREEKEKGRWNENATKCILSVH